LLFPRGAHKGKQYMPTVFDIYSATIECGKGVLTLDLWEVSTSEDYSRLRPLLYPQTDIFLFCFSVDCQSSLASIRSKWAPEVTHFMPEMCPKATLVLVATKVDLRDDPSTIEKMRVKQRAPVTREEGIALAKELGVDAFCETSSLTGEGIAALFKRSCAIFMRGRQGQPEISAAGRKCVLQ
jgi:cell division control protein 42